LPHRRGHIAALRRIAARARCARFVNGNTDPLCYWSTNAVPDISTSETVADILGSTSPGCAVPAHEALVP